MSDYDFEIKDFLGRICTQLDDLVMVLRDIRDKMEPQEGDYKEDYS
jgi:predicted glycosyltransferase